MSETENTELAKVRAWVATLRRDGYTPCSPTLADMMALDAEIDRLARELREAKDFGAKELLQRLTVNNELEVMTMRLADADAKVARLREDAERWRAARRLMCERKHENLHELIVDLTGAGFDDPTEDAAMDALIDAVRAGGA